MQERTRKWRRAESLAILRGLEDDHKDDGDAPSEARDDEGTQQPGIVGSVALGHHADDQVETVLLKALRGCHLANLHGMRWRDGPFVRPLLSLRKAALVEYLDGLGQPWVEDQSNAQPTYKRNRVRLQLVPLLEELAGGGDALVARVQAMEHQSASLHDWLDVAATDYLAEEPNWRDDDYNDEPRKLSIARLRTQPMLLQEQLLHTLVDQVPAAKGRRAAALSYASLRHVLRQLEQPKATKWSLDVTRDCRLRRRGDWLSAEPLRADVISDDSEARDVIE